MSCGLTSQVFLFAQTTTHRRDFIVKEIELLGDFEIETVFSNVNAFFFK